MTTFYVATDRDSNGPKFCEGHGSVAEATKCARLKGAGEYVYAVVNGTQRALTPEELREEAIAKMDS